MDRPVRPERPAAAASPPASGWRAWISILMALMLLLFVLTLFGAVLITTLGVGVGPLLAVGGIFAMAGLHYVLWGRWLGPMIHQDVAEEERRRQAENKG